MSDDERQRLASLFPNLIRRARIFDITRQFFNNREFLEIETPIRTPAVAPEKEIIPFESEGLTLITSPELYMKRLLSAGYERIYQISHCFRKEEHGRLHNPEFTLLEWYRAGATYENMIEDTETLISEVASDMGNGGLIEYRGITIDLKVPWLRHTIRDLYLQLAGWDPVENPDPRRFDMDMVTKIIPGLEPGRPTIMFDYPAKMASLARVKPGSPQVAERAEIFIGGLELANAYSELTDSEEQENRFKDEIDTIQREQGRIAPLPQQFIDSLAYLPPCAGIALGMDRLVMLFCDASGIDEVIPFTIDTA
jgi:lysyl-tRNA synthetase class 2